MKKNLFNFSDDDELNDILETKPSNYTDCHEVIPCNPVTAKACDYKINGKVVQWSISDDTIFIPTRKTIKALPPNYYNICEANDVGIYFEKLPINGEDIISFPHTKTDEILKEISNFWEKEQIFKDFKLTFARGQLIYGPPGSGKSFLLRAIADDVIKRKGIVIKFDNPYLFISGIRLLREIQPNTPIVVLMEDIDSLIRNYSETMILNILDGVDKFDKIVYMATTNYPELLGQRIVNRPSRFDKRWKIGFPTEYSREIYFKHLIQDRDLKINISQWVEDTKGFTFAHLRELFVAVVILDNDYDTALNTLKSMKSVVSSENDSNETLGFRSKLYEESKNGKHTTHIP